MGWTGQYFHGVKNTTKKFKEIIFADYGEDKIVYIYNVGNTFYMAVKPTNDRVYAVVVLCRRDGDEFMVKYQSEVMKPLYYGANAKLLSMLTETDDDDAIEWRKNCRKEIEKTKNALKPKVGDVLVFETPLNYCKLGEHTRLTKEKQYYSVMVHGQKMLVNLPSRILKNCPFTIE